MPEWRKICETEGSVHDGESKHLLIVHQRLLPVVAGHEQNIRQPCFRNAAIIPDRL
jgi:hypothetical protein